MGDQAERLRQMAEDLKKEIHEKAGPRPEKRARVIAVTSGKGGVGKTNVSVNLGYALLHLRKEVILLDADLGLANVDVLLGTNPPRHLGHLLRGEAGILDLIYRGPGNLKIIAAGSGLQELVDLPEGELLRFIQSLRTLESRTDFLILDTGAGLSRSVLNFVLAADEVILVSTPEPTAMTDAYATIKVITRRNPSAQIKVVMNMVENQEEAEVAVNRLANAAMRFLGIHLESLGHIPGDPLVTTAVKGQSPFFLKYPDAPSSLAVKAIASTLVGDEGSKGLGLFFERLGKFFTGWRR